MEEQKYKREFQTRYLVRRKKKKHSKKLKTGKEGCITTKLHKQVIFSRESERSGRKPQPERKYWFLVDWHLVPEQYTGKGLHLYNWKSGKEEEEVDIRSFGATKDLCVCSRHAEKTAEGLRGWVAPVCAHGWGSLEKLGVLKILMVTVEHGERFRSETLF